MATRNPIAQAGPGAQFCDYCHQKPKFSNHSYCSKTCAAQAATLCNYCHKKPKFQNFDYCGKNCASQANPGGVKAAAGNARPPQGPNAQAKPFATGQRGPQQQTKPAFDPMQIAKLVAQQIPQVQALLGPNGLAALGQQQQPAPPPSNNQYAPQPAPPTNRSVNSNSSNPINNPFMNSMNPSSMPMPGPGHSNIPFATNNLQQQQQQQQYQQPINADDLECRIPGCGKPVHIDAKGLKTSDYCSQRHREEAVSSGLVSPCIMCLTKPQSHTDYFCGRTCREESLNKRYDPAEETRIEEVEDDEAHFVDPNGNAIDNNGQILN